MLIWLLRTPSLSHRIPLWQASQPTPTVTWCGNVILAETPAALLGSHSLPFPSVQFSFHFSLARTHICSRTRRRIRRNEAAICICSPANMQQRHTHFMAQRHQHSPCMTDGTCQDAKRQPRNSASLKWPSAHAHTHTHTGRRANERVDD